MYNYYLMYFVKRVLKIEYLVFIVIIQFYNNDLVLYNLNMNVVIFSKFYFDNVVIGFFCDCFFQLYVNFKYKKSFVFFYCI